MQESQYYIRQREQLLNQPLLSWPGLSGWSFYFLGKVTLAYLDFIQFATVYNLAFAALLIFPLRFRASRVIRQVVAIPAAFALLYYESYLPPFARLVEQWEQLAAFSPQYLLELTSRVIQLQYIAIILIAWIAYLYLARSLRMTVIALAAIISVPMFGPAPADQLDDIVMQSSTGKSPLSTSLKPQTPANFLADFYEEQAQFILPVKALQSPNFDVLMINICSLSWDDLAYSGLLQHPVLSQAHIVLDNFNSASSYSGPAALRLLRASCGHSPHDNLFEPAPEVCMLAENLAQLGYSHDLLLNHSGEYDNFKGLLRDFGGLAAANEHSHDNIAVHMTGFDGTPIYADYPILKNWLDGSNSAPRFAFYNTTSLHDGNILPAFDGNSLESFRVRAQTMLDDLLQLQQDIRESGRNVMVIIVPEHGAGLRGDKLQLPGLREIPSPQLTHVPVLMTLFGADINQMPRQQQRVTHNTGPAAIAAAINEIQAQRPFTGGDYDPVAVAEALPMTPWLAENKDVKVMEYNNQFILQIRDQNWIRYPGSSR